MSYFASAHGRGVAGHVERLHDGLAALGQQVRAAIAHVIGRAVADATRDGVRHLLGGPPEGPFTPTPRWGEPARPSWRPEGADRDRLDDDAYRDWRDDPLERDEEDREPAPAPAGRPQSAEWEGALAAGCQAAAWWLRRRRGPRPALLALGVGAGTALACLARPLSPATALLVAAVSLASLADVV